MRKLSALLVLFIFCRAEAQDDDLGKRTNIVFISSEIIGNDNFEKDELVNWVKGVQQVNGGLMKTETANAVVKIIASWEKGGNCRYEVTTCPENRALAEKVKTQISQLYSPVARFTGFQLLLLFKYHDGCGEKESFSPAILTRDVKMKTDLEAAPLLRQKEMIRNWARNEVIPVLAHYTGNVSAEFAGVRETSALLLGEKYLGHKTDSLLNGNLLYWRAVMEMNKGNMLIPAARVFMYVANDEMDKARRYMTILFRFADKESLASHYLLDLNKYLSVFYKTHDSLINAGIVLHDAGKYNEAISRYDAVLRDYPYSAWAAYERYYSLKYSVNAAADADKSNALWNTHKESVYGADPLYPMGGGASNAREGYILFRHLQIKDLFSDSKKLRADLATYADIALDLENYAFAAHLYWYLMTALPEEKHNGHSFLVYYLYSLQKLGVTGAQAFFKENYKPEIATIDHEREEAMKNDPVYKSFRE